MQRCEGGEPASRLMVVGGFSGSPVRIRASVGWGVGPSVVGVAGGESLGGRDVYVGAPKASGQSRTRGR